MNTPELITRSITGFFIVAISIVAIVWSEWSYLIWLCFIACFCTLEYLKLSQASMSIGYRILLAVSMALLTGWTGYAFIRSENWLLAIFILPIIMSIFFIVRWFNTTESETLVSGNTSAYSALSYIGMPVLSGCIFLTGDYSYVMVLVPVILIWINDVGAYLIGSLLGKHKIAPSISPGKSIEGTIGGAMMTLTAGYILSKIWPQIPFSYILCVSVITPVFALAGDLWESAIKRNAGVKDSGDFLPGHGGILDRYDSLLFVMPAAALAYYIFVL